MLNSKRILVTGGTGTLGSAICEHLLSLGACVTVFSRSENEQHKMRQRISDEHLHFTIGDVRDYQSVRSAVRHADIVCHCAALKQVPACEYFPAEAIRTNVGGAQNIVQAISEEHLPVECVVGISTDKAAYPACVYGNTKALQEATLIQANLEAPDTRFVSVRLGNLIGSRGSVALIFREQVASGGPVTITDPAMTRFWFGPAEAVGVVMTAINEAKRGEIIVPKIGATTVEALARAFIGSRPISKRIIGIRPGEKKHETLISEEEAMRCVQNDGHYVLYPAMGEFGRCVSRIGGAYTSDQSLMSDEELMGLLERYGLV